MLLNLKYKNTDGVTINIGSAPPYYLLSREGFSAVNNTITSEKTYGLDGETFISQTLDVRNLTINGFVLGDTRVELNDLRRDLIKAFNPKLAGTLTLQNDNGTYVIDVIPELAPNISDKSTGIGHEFTITLKALDPYWQDESLGDGLIELSTIEPKFNFPLAISSAFVFATAKSGEIITVLNDGDVDTGCLFRLRLVTTVVNPRIYNIYSQEFFGFSGTFVAGTVFEVSTTRGDKYARKFLTEWENAMPNRMSGSTFMQITRGSNYLQIQADSGVDGCLGDLEFAPKLLGV